MKTYLKKNKTLLILPLIVLPFTVFIFYILGGGRDAGAGSNEGGNHGGAGDANYTLPDADHSIEIYDKIEAYSQEGVMQAATYDYRIGGPGDSGMVQPIFVGDSSILTGVNGQGLIKAKDTGDLLEYIRQKGGMSRDGLNQAVAGEAGRKSINLDSKKPQLKEQDVPPKTRKTNVQPQSAITLTGIQELDRVFNENISLSKQNDSLKFYLNQAQGRLQEIESKQRASFTLEKKEGLGFETGETKPTLIKAEVYETTTVVDGNRVKLRLLEDAWLGGQKVARNSFIYGVCKTANERLHISITQIPVEGGFLPVNITILDLDGLPGLYVPDNAARKVTKEVGGGTTTSSLFGTTDNALAYIGLRAADRTAQGFLKRVRLKKVTIKKNTLVYLINENQ